MGVAGEGIDRGAVGLDPIGPEVATEGGGGFAGEVADPGRRGVTRGRVEQPGDGPRASGVEGLVETRRRPGVRGVEVGTEDRPAGR